MSSSPRQVTIGTRRSPSSPGRGHRERAATAAPGRSSVGARSKRTRGPAPLTGQPRAGFFWRHRRFLWCAGLLLFTAISGVLYLFARVPLPAAVPSQQTTTLSYSDSTTRLASLVAEENRVAVPLDRIPEVVRQAVIATEDRKFYQHRGIDPLGVIRAAVADAKAQGVRQGGSTITQQYVKVTYTAREKSVARKIKEAVLAIKLEQQLSKDQILERYLNAVYFGRGAYGTQAAAQAYFGRNVEDLGLREAAYLAGLIRAPETADVEDDPDAAKNRRDRTVRAMVATGAITLEQARDAESTPVGAYTIRRRSEAPTVADRDIGTQYFVDMVRRSLIARYGEEVALGGGLQVTTSLDRVLQADAFEAVTSTLNPTDPAAAVVALDGNGRIVAMVGGRDYEQSQVNLALGRDGGGGGRGAGSTFKPFLLAAAVKEGYTVESAFQAPPTYTIPGADDGEDYELSNYEGESPAAATNLITATELSINTVYVQLEQALGNGNVRAGAAKLATMAKDMGVSAPLQPNASLVLGSSPVSPLDMAAGFSTLASGGLRVSPVSILEIRDREGKILHQAKPERARILERSEADVVTHCLRQVVETGTGTGAQLDAGRVAAGKTGTTNDYADAWFVGYTPAPLTAAVWMGWPEGESRTMESVQGRPVTGGSLPATIWQRFMDAAYRHVGALRDGPSEFTTPASFPGRVFGRTGRISAEASRSATSTTLPGDGPASSDVGATSTPSTPATTAPAKGRSRSSTSTTRPTTTTTRRAPPTTAVATQAATPVSVPQPRAP